VRRIANAFVLLMASAAVAFAASGFQDEIFFSLGGGVLVVLLVRCRARVRRAAHLQPPACALASTSGS